MVDSVKPDLEVVADRQMLGDRAAEYIAVCAGRAIESRGRFALALAGGTTPFTITVMVSLSMPPWPSLAVKTISP